MHKIVITIDVKSLKAPRTKQLIIRGALPFVPAEKMLLVMNDGPGEVLLQVDEIQWRKPMGKDGYFVVNLVDLYKAYTREQVRDAYKADGWSIDVD